jgi:p-aminobenzoyl-glutamate transporter AbgT
MTPVQPVEQDAPLKHSGPGIASFVVGLLSILTTIISMLVTIVGLADYTDENGMLFVPDQEEFVTDASILTGVLLFFLGVLLSVVGVVLGIVGCVIRNRKRVFAIVGLVLSSLVTVGTIITTLFGLAAQSQ